MVSATNVVFMEDCLMDIAYLILLAHNSFNRYKLRYEKVNPDHIYKCYAKDTVCNAECFSYVLC